MAFNNRLKTGSGSASGLSQINYKFTCRCCLKSDAEFLKLDTMTVARNLDPSEADKIPLLRCLLFCIRAENSPELPQYICVECSKSLQIAYYFLQNALRAHEILCRKLCPGKVRPTLAQRFNGSIKQPEVAPRQAAEDQTKPQKAFRHECKLCGFVVYNRTELKEHIHQHVDGSSYSCKVCSFVTLKKRLLQEHYSATHGMSANLADERVKPKSTSYSTGPSTSSAAAAAATANEEFKVCTLEDMELLIPTVLTPGDYVQPSIDEEQVQDIEQELAVSIGQPVPVAAETLTNNLSQMQGKNMSIGSEYVLMADGSMQVNGGGVVIEYIDDCKPNRNTTGNMSLQNLLGGGPENEPMEIDVSELIVEEMVPQIKVKPRPVSIGSTPLLKYKCKACPKAFATLGRLKSHQLSHSHLPKFYCDQCPFYSLRSTELCLHYKASHLNKEEKGGAKETVDEWQTYSCDMCLFEGRNARHLRVHYTDKHMIQPTEVQLRPSWTSESATAGGGITSARTSGQGSKEQGAQPQHTEIPLGIQYPPAALAAAAAATATATVGNQPMLQQQQQHQDQEQQQLSAIATQTSTITQSGEINVVVDATPLFFAATAAGTETVTVTGAEEQEEGQGQASPGTIAADTIANGEEAYEIFPEISTSSLTATQPGPALPTTSTTSANISIFGDMQEFIDNTDVAAICTIPADDMPVVDGDDIVIDNNNMSLDFDAENLFEDFEDEEEAVGEEEEDEEEDDDDDEDAENEDENDNNDAATDQNLLLTSDDDDVDDFDDEQSKHLQKPYCIFCNKKFTSQYKFENHMFVHRGLAPYRCELCTNLYNMKRLLIRHYKTVHKRMPTRDMVQAKGDKVLVARTNIETIQLDTDRKPMLMCAKCPFECELDTEMRKHLNAHHGINDGVSLHANEVFIIRKLPFECPRCIRSFAAKSTLTRHLQRSHLVDTIIEMQSNQTTSSSAATTTSTTCTATTSMPANTADDNGNKGQQQGTETVGYGDGDVVGDGVGECEVEVKPEEGAGIKEEPTSAASASASIRTAIKAESASEIIPNPPDESPEPRIMNSIDHVLVKGETSSVPHIATTTASSSSTPTPFDFDFDFIGDAGKSRLTPTFTPTPPSTSNSQIVSTTPLPCTSTSTTSTDACSPSPLLNGSDKLLTAAMEPSPFKGLRSRTPRTQIYACKLCKKSFDELGKLVKHEMDTHSIGESKRSGYEHRCGTCGTTYRTMALLKFHMKRHANRKFSCKFCEKDFVHKTEMDRHILAKHATEKSFRCSLDGCRKMFAFKHHLVRHQNASHLKLRHVCAICQKEVKTSQHLRHHMTVHRGMTAYKCPKCDRTYLRRGALRVHALSVHKVRLTEDELAEIFRHNVGYTNPHDMKVIARNGQLVRRKELEVERENELQLGDEPSQAEANIS